MAGGRIVRREAYLGEETSSWCKGNEGGRYRYGFCEAAWWRPEEREAAKSLLEGLREQASAQRERLRNQGRSVDVDTWLWPGGEPNYAEALAEEVVRLAGEDAGKRETLAGVADRLLDRKHVRLMSVRERDAADALLRGARWCAQAGKSNSGRSRWRKAKMTTINGSNSVVGALR